MLQRRWQILVSIIAMVACDNDNLALQESNTKEFFNAHSLSIENEHVADRSLLGTISTVFTANIHGGTSGSAIAWEKRENTFAQYIINIGSPRILILHEITYYQVASLKAALMAKGTEYLYSSVCKSNVATSNLGTAILSKNSWQVDPYCVPFEKSSMVRAQVLGLWVIGFHSGDPNDIQTAAYHLLFSPGAAVIGGDFNQPPRSSHMDLMYSFGTDIYERSDALYPTSRIRLSGYVPCPPASDATEKIDYLFYKGMAPPTGLITSPPGTMTSAYDWCGGASYTTDHKAVRAVFVH